MNTFEIREACQIMLPDVTYNLPALTLQTGECAVIFAPSESRPDDLLKVLGGSILEDGFFVPPAPGEIMQRKVDLNAFSFPLFLNDNRLYDRNAQRGRVGTIFSVPDLNIIGRTVLEDYKHALASVRFEPEDQLAGLELRAYDLSHKMTFATEKLSGGEKQRLNCATAFVGERDLLVVDFSAISLDVEFRQFFLRLLDRFCGGGGIAIISGIRRDDLQLLPHAICRNFVVRLAAGVYQLSEENPCDRLYPPLSKESELLLDRLQARKIGSADVVVVDKVYRKNKTMAADFRVSEGEIVIVHGPNGSGKTTLGQILSGRIDRSHYQGIFHVRPGTRALMATQYPDEMILETKTERELPDAVLRGICGVPDSAGDPRQLPYGVRKLLGVANALRLSRGVAILDEPSAGLDFPQKLRLVDLLNHYSGLAVIVFTHDQALERFGRVVHLQKEMRK